MVGLAIRIAIELVLVVVILPSAVVFGQAVKGLRYTRQRAQDQEFLDGFIQAMNAEMPFSERTLSLERIDESWAYNLDLVTKVHFQALNNMRNLNLIVCVAILVVSFFLGWVFLGINALVFALVALLAPRRAPLESALRELVSVAQILYCWKRDDRATYETFLQGAWGIRGLAECVDRYAT